jgi:hypothetical protein
MNDTRMTDADVERIATEAARRAVRETFLALGVNAADPESVVEMQKDFAHIRDSRLAFVAMKTRAYMVATGTVVTGIIAAVWMALRGNGH